MERGKGADINRFFDWFGRWRRNEVKIKSEEEMEAAINLAVAAGIASPLLRNLLDERGSREERAERIEDIKEIRHSFFLTLRELSREARDCRKHAEALKLLATRSFYKN